MLELFSSREDTVVDDDLSRSSRRTRRLVIGQKAKFREAYQKMKVLELL